MFRHVSKIKILDTDKFAILLDTPCNAAASTPNALSWNIFLPAQEADTETKTAKDLNAFLVVTAKNWKSLTSMSSWHFSLTADCLLCPSSLRLWQNSTTKVFSLPIFPFRAMTFSLNIQAKKKR